MNKKVALITGASTGIGKELARVHAQNNGDLILVARSENKLQDLKKELEGTYSVKVDIIVKDLSITSAPLEVYDEVKKMNLKVDYLINNAGFGGRGKFHERDWDLDYQMINLNITALAALTRLFLPDFVKRNSGRILNVSSTASFMPGPLQAVYYATKTFVTFFSNAVAEELHDTNVTVTNLMPGATETEFARVSDMDKTSLFDKTFSPVVVAKDGYKAMLKGKLDVISRLNFGQKIMFAMLPFMPKKALLKQVRKMQEVN
jgi:short-subunit dehydrogenase